MEQFKVSCQYTITIQSQLPVNCTNSNSVASKIKQFYVVAQTVINVFVIGEYVLSCCNSSLQEQVMVINESWIYKKHDSLMSWSAIILNEMWINQVWHLDLMNRFHRTDF